MPTLPAPAPTVGAGVFVFSAKTFRRLMKKVYLCRHESNMEHRINTDNGRGNSLRQPSDDYNRDI